MTILVTGAAGFIGFHLTQALLARGEAVIGIDDLNPYYDVRLKQARLAILRNHHSFGFFQANIADHRAMMRVVDRLQHVTTIVHLAAQAGVRYSLENPYAYIEANVMGQTVMLELARVLKAHKHFVYASSSSVYGANAKLPFSVEDPVEEPVSLYAATKRSGELIASTYNRLYGIPVTGLRFFTVYGPWGRPDMAYFSFVKAAFEGTPVTLFNNGEMRRDFTYIDDIVAGVLAVMDKPRSTPALYNLGNHKTETLGDFVAEIERATGRTIEKRMAPMQKGDVPATYADIARSQADLGFDPKTSIAEGLPKFVAWYREFYQVSKTSLRGA
jgi:UDP-glucuronate 4-epimerase